MNATLVLVLVFFLVVMAGLAGIGIGLIIGLVLGSRDEQTAAPPQAVAPAPVSQPTPSGSTEASPDGTASAPLVTTAAGQVRALAPARRASTWSVVIAIAVIVFCCCCTFLLASLTTIGQ